MDPWFDGFEARRIDVGGGMHLQARLGGRAGAPALLLLHGYPQTHVLWHRVAQRLAPHFRLVLPDLRGYGDSDTPPDEPGHAQQSKRAMAADLAALMRLLGHERYAVAGHDRGGRVAHRLALDHAPVVAKLALLDIAPTLDMYERTDLRFARSYYHWFFLVQPAPHPERMIGADPVAYLHWKIGGWGSQGLGIFEPRALAEYERCFSKASVIHGSCEDYRAAIGIDLDHDRASRAAGQRIACDTLALWGERGVVHALFDPLALWQAQCAGRVDGQALPCGHYIAEELPEQAAQALLQFFSP